MDIPSIVIASAAVLGLLFAALAWLYKRGAEERELTVAVRDNTKATTSLAETFASYVEKTDQRYSELDRRVGSHDTRITVVERDIEHLKAS